MSHLIFGNTRGVISIKANQRAQRDWPVLIENQGCSRLEAEESPRRNIDAVVHFPGPQTRVGIEP
jgi:hypothetical protein